MTNLISVFAMPPGMNWKGFEGERSSGKKCATNDEKQIEFVNCGIEKEGFICEVSLQ